MLATVASTLLESVDTFLLEQRRTRRERVTAKSERELRNGMREMFETQEREFLESFVVGLTADEVNAIWRSISESTNGEAATVAQAAITDSFVLGHRTLALDLAVDISFDLSHPRAVSFLENYGAEMVTRIDETSRRDIQRILTNGLRRGDSYQDMATEIRGKFRSFRIPKPQQHIRDRAELIAVTEAGNAYEAGNLEFAREVRDLGLSLEKAWLTVGDLRVDDEVCNPNGTQGFIPIEQPFTSGHMRPLGHPACRCSMLTRRIGSNA